MNWPNWEEANNYVTDTVTWFCGGENAPWVELGNEIFADPRVVAAYAGAFQAAIDDGAKGQVVIELRRHGGDIGWEWHAA